MEPQSSIKTKVCSGCHTAKPALLSHFYESPTGRMGLQAMCIPCLKTYAQARYQKAKFTAREDRLYLQKLAAWHASLLPEIRAQCPSWPSRPSKPSAPPESSAIPTDRTCKTCGIVKPLTLEFWVPDYRARHGYKPHCCVCWDKRTLLTARRRKDQRHTAADQEAAELGAVPAAETSIEDPIPGY